MEKFILGRPRKRCKKSNKQHETQDWCKTIDDAMEVLFNLWLMIAWLWRHRRWRPSNWNGFGNQKLEFLHSIEASKQRRSIIDVSKLAVEAVINLFRLSFTPKLRLNYSTLFVLFVCSIKSRCELIKSTQQLHARSMTSSMGVDELWSCDDDAAVFYRFSTKVWANLATFLEKRMRSSGQRQTQEGGKNLAHLDM